jgi:hypothetical protein
LIFRRCLVSKRQFEGKNLSGPTKMITVCDGRQVLHSDGATNSLEPIHPVSRRTGHSCLT